MKWNRLAIVFFVCGWIYAVADLWSKSPVIMDIIGATEATPFIVWILVSIVANMLLFGILAVFFLIVIYGLIPWLRGK